MEKNIEKRAANKAHKKLISADKTFDVANVVIMILLFFIFAWPLWFVVIASFSDPGEVWRGNVILFPKGFSIDSYTEILKYKEIWIGYRNTIFYTVVGTVINLFMTVCMAYPLSRKKFMPKNILMVLCMITMYFGGGLIPSYLVVKNLHMIDTVWAMMIPGCLSVYNMIIMRSYFVNSIPDSLEEAATLDGAGPVQYLVKVVLPLSKPVIAVIALYYMVGHWNDFFSALIYVNDKNLLPLQTFLRNLLVTNTVGNVSQTQNRRPARGRKRSRLRTRGISALCLAAGIFLAVPGLMEPRELFVPLLVGAAAMGAGIIGLWQSRARKKNPFDRAAKILLEGKDKSSAEQAASVSFSEEGMTVPAGGGKAEFVPYREFECAVETADSFLFVFGGRVLLLQKMDLKAECTGDFCSLISEKVKPYHSIA